MKDDNTIEVFQVRRDDAGQVQAGLRAVPWRELKQGEVSVRVLYSSLNYKDALGISGKGKIFKKFPLVPGIDAAGVVLESSDARYQPGMEVLVTGCGFGETHHGGYTPYASVPADWLVPCPPGLSLREAMALGTAGFTAALCIQRLQDNGQTPAHGPFVVTGATGGVGSLAVNMLASLGYEVVAVSGKTAEANYLHSLGAAKVLHPDELGCNLPPLASVRWGGAIDNVGGEVLAALAAATQLWGNIACVGLALAPSFQASVMPMILRGVSLLGISSTNCPYPLRARLWRRLASELKPKALAAISGQEIGLSDLPRAVDALLQRRMVGRYLVNCQK